MDRLYITFTHRAFVLTECESIPCFQPIEIEGHICVSVNKAELKICHIDKYFLKVHIYGNYSFVLHAGVNDAAADAVAAAAAAAADDDDDNDYDDVVDDCGV